MAYTLGRLGRFSLVKRHLIKRTCGSGKTCCLERKDTLLVVGTGAAARGVRGYGW